MDAMGTAAGQFMGLCNQQSSYHGHSGSSKMLQVWGGAGCSNRGGL